MSFCICLLYRKQIWFKNIKNLWHRHILQSKQFYSFIYKFGDNHVTLLFNQCQKNSLKQVITYTFSENAKANNSSVSILSSAEKEFFGNKDYCHCHVRRIDLN